MLKKSIPFIFVLLWSTGFIGTKFGLPYATTGDFLSIRALANIAVFTLLILFLKPATLTKPQIFHASITGLLIHGAYLGGVFSAIEFGLSAGVTAIIVGLQPLFTAMIAIAVFNSKVTKSQWVALVFGLIGLVLVVSASIDFATVSFSALSFAFIALAGITIGTIYQKRYCQDQSLLSSVYWQYIASLFVFIPIAILEASVPINWTIEFILSLSWLVLVLSVIAILLLMYMVEQGDASKVTSYFYLVPPTTAIQAWIIFDEQLALISIIGMIVCSLSVYFITQRK